MLLALDIGNTNISIGVFRDGHLEATWRMATDTQRMADEYGLFLNDLLPLKGVSPKEIKKVALCSVVPPLTPVFEELCRAYLHVEPLVVGVGVKTGIRILYDNPKDVGTDRVADAVAALHLYGGPVIIVDFGTATVFDAISQKGDYLGGAIAPGLNIASDALFYNTSMLRRVELAAPPQAVGKNTVHSLQSGLVLGYAGLVEGMVARFKRELELDAKDVPHIVWGDTNGWYYTTWEGVSREKQRFEEIGCKKYYAPQMTLTPDGTPHVVMRQLAM